MVLTDWLHEIISNARKGQLPSSEEIVNHAFADLGFVEGKIPPPVARRRFNEILEKVFLHTLTVLESFEAPVYGKEVMSKFVQSRQGDVERVEHDLRNNSLSSVVSHLLEIWYPHLREIFLSISQSRKQRGGKDFELQLAGLFGLSNISFEMQKSKDRIDFFLPSHKVFLRDRNKALVASAKRTLRERWKQVAEELFSLRSPNVYLLTTDEAITSDKIAGLTANNIYLVVWDRVKQRYFVHEPKILGYSAFVNDVISIFEQRWS